MFEHGDRSPIPSRNDRDAIAWIATGLDNPCDGGILASMLPDAAAPEGYHTLTPRMVVTDVAGAVQFLRATFDASGDVVAGRPAEIRIGDSLVMVTPVGERDLFPALLYVYVADADETYRRALVAGAVTLEEPMDTPYGDRRAMVRDPFGNVFQIAHRRAPSRR